MKAIMLGAGQGSRLRPRTDGNPKLFLEVDGKTIFERQLDALAPLVEQGLVDERIVVVLGYGFAEDSIGDRSRSEKIDEYVRIDDRFEFEIIVLPYWSAVENAASALAGINVVDDDALLLCGDVITTDELLSSVVERFHDDHRSEGYSTVAAIEGVQDEMTAIDWDDSRTVTDYGAIEGHQEAGIFVLNRDHFDTAGRLLCENAVEEWFPIVFPEVPSKAVTVDPRRHAEINTEEHFREAERKLPLEPADGSEIEL
ncbi:NTP transferase domain-containing protein [Halorussus salinisoli]|uniref:NTP transferase domain-containing protein n=1 Tax=Halorussus salinisoli TaxID=2558242 RepID=UPI0014850C85|nr:NTP transferase domain-containing protein [Halorussus salinisoli]